MVCIVKNYDFGLENFQDFPEKVLICVHVWSKQHRFFLGNLRLSSEIFRNLRRFTENVWKRVSGLRKTFGESSEIFGKRSSLVCLYNKQNNIWVRVQVLCIIEFEILRILMSLELSDCPQYRGIRIRSGQAVHRWQEIVKCCRDVLSMHLNKVANWRNTKACFKQEESRLQNLHCLVNLSNYLKKGIRLHTVRDDDNYLEETNEKQERRNLLCYAQFLRVRF